MATAELLLTAEEFWQMPDDGLFTELIRGRVVTLNMPAPRHGYFCLKIGRILGNFVDDHDLGRVVSNDSGVVTERSPDSVRGADIAFYSYARLPRGPFPQGYLSVSPELVFEVRSPSDLWKEILAKVAEYLKAGVLVVGVHDEQTQTITLYRQDELPRVLTITDELTLPELHADFRAPVARFFE
ncbi:MAG: Uma2 family endonuclease [Planctomycetia bacterium]|nr:Uma2 family endonuclease [Planctomycetia bacterium]